MRPDLLLPLITGHLLGDFVLQSDRMVRAKGKVVVLMAHCGIVAAASWGLTGHFRSWWWMTPTLFAAHLLIDVAKRGSAVWIERAREDVRTPGVANDNATLALYSLDQAAHVLVILLLVWQADANSVLRATLDPQSRWVELLGQSYLRTLVLISGWTVAALVAGRFLGMLLGRFEVQLTEPQRGGLEKGGYWIGVTERSLIYLFILVGEPTGIGFLAAAKSVFRIGELKEAEDRKLAEYILIGTLLSFALAMVIGLLTREVLQALR